MKSKTFFLMLLFLAPVLMGYAQDFWNELEVPENTGVYCIKGNTNGQTYLGARGFHISTDHGLTWNPTSFTKLTGTIDINLQTGDVFIGNHLGVFYSTNNGDDWCTTSFSDNAQIVFLSIYNNLFVGNWGEIYKSTDLGNTWVQVLELSNTQVVNSIVENPDAILFAGLTSFTGGGGVYRSVDGGDTWVHAGLWNHYISSLAINSQGILFAGSIGDEGVGIYSSDDNGETWMGLKNNVFVDAIAITPDDVIFIGCSNEHGTQGGVFRSDNHGETWVLINTGLNNHCVYGLSLAPDGYLYAYGNHLHRSINPVFDPNLVPIQEANDLTVFPNPFIDFLHFKFFNGKYSSEDYSVKVFDPLGRLVFSQELGGLQDGTINLSSLPQGMYYISVEINGQRYAKPIIKY